MQHVIPNHVRGKFSQVSVILFRGVFRADSHPSPDYELPGPTPLLGLIGRRAARNVHRENRFIFLSLQELTGRWRQVHPCATSIIPLQTFWFFEEPNFHRQTPVHLQIPTSTLNGCLLAAHFRPGLIPGLSTSTRNLRFCSVTVSLKWKHLTVLCQRLGPCLLPGHTSISILNTAWLRKISWTVLLV